MDYQGANDIQDTNSMIHVHNPISILKNIKEDTSEIGAIKEEVSTARYEARREREEIISTLKSGSLEEKYEQLSREIAEIKVAIAEIRAKVS